MVSEIGVVPGEHDDRGLEAALAQAAHHFAAIGIRQPDIHQHEIGGIGLGGAGALGAGIDGGGLELVVQRQLLHQRIAQIGVVIHDQDLAGIGHWYNPLGRRRRWRALKRRQPILKMGRRQSWFVLR